MTDFSITKQVTGEKIDTRWRAQRHGQEVTVPGTLDPSKFEALGFKAGDVLPSGTALAKLSSGLRGPFVAGEGAVLDGYLNDDAGVVLTKQPTCAVLKHGVIEIAYLPIAAQRATVKAAKTDGSYIYIED
ncbi:hypothetical protein QE418_003387 [Microbacterium testaceum]|uniref:hypothetical protein n=1 Tax=Microbacterium TaxID=33882 RepID=UPI00278109C9|nr:MULTISPECIES: hypothetical protein [Microbacterium]MDQ1113939.1 hypothetical protein [Microbacterium testaceum]MDR6098954.1 hypothetical protein [Microbacterium sp. SORGH_AS_0454]